MPECRLPQKAKKRLPVALGCSITDEVYERLEKEIEK